MFRTLTQFPLEGERLAELPDPEPAEPALPEPGLVDPVSPVPVLPTDPVPEPVEPEPAEPLPPVPVPPPVLVPEPEPPVCPVPPPVLVPEPELPVCPVPPPVLVPEPEPPPVPRTAATGAGRYRSRRIRWTPTDPTNRWVPPGAGRTMPDPANGAAVPGGRRSGGAATRWRRIRRAPTNPENRWSRPGTGAHGPDPPEATVPEAADDPAVPAPCVLDGNPWDPTADVPDDTSCRAARCLAGSGARDGPLWPCDGTAGGATGTDRPGTGVTPPTTASWLDDRGADGRTWIDTVAIMTKMTAAAEKKNTGSALPAG